MRSPLHRQSASQILTFLAMAAVGGAGAPSGSLVLIGPQSGGRSALKQDAGAAAKAGVRWDEETIAEHDKVNASLNILFLQFHRTSTRYCCRFSFRVERLRLDFHARVSSFAGTRHSNADQ